MPTPLTVVAMTPPVEATIRILLNSVPYLIGAAVVRQPPGSDSLVAQVGRMPWLHDSRLTTLQLPDDSLPANRAVALDWPVPFQAEWVGVPPRLLISRLVVQGRTVGVLLGTLITRDMFSQQTREALDLSCELIASAVASDSLIAFAATAALNAAAIADGRRQVAPAEPALEPEPRPEVVPSARMPLDERAQRVVEDVGRALEGAADARALGRVMRDAMNTITEASAFSVSLFHAARPEVAYRYKVVGSDRASSELGRQLVDDGPACYATRRDRRWHVFAREVTMRGQVDIERLQAIVVQLPLVAGDEVIGVVTLQTFRQEGFSDQELRLVATVVETAAPHFGHVRTTGQFQPSTSNAPSPLGPAATAVLPAAAAVSHSTPDQRQRTADDVLRELLAYCTELGFPTSLLVGVDPGAAVLRGELVSASEAARELDYRLGITDGRFVIPLNDRYNAIARACREARIVSAPTIHELAQPLCDWQAAMALERLVHGGRSVIIPLIVNTEVVGALIVGPMSEEPAYSAVEGLRSVVEAAANELDRVWRADGGRGIAGGGSA